MTARWGRTAKRRQATGSGAARVLAVALVVSSSLLVLPPTASAGEPSTTVWYWTTKRARTELALDGLTARCRGKYDRFQIGNDWYYRYFRCSSRAAGRFDLIVQGAHLYEVTPVVEPDPTP